MRCPKCSYSSFDYNEACPNCGRDLSPVRQMLGLLAVIPQPMPYLEELLGQFDEVEVEAPDEASSSSAHLGDYEEDDFEFEGGATGTITVDVPEVQLEAPEEVVELEAPDIDMPVEDDAGSDEIEFDLSSFDEPATPSPAPAQTEVLDETDQITLDEEGIVFSDESDGELEMQDDADSEIEFGDSTFIMEGDSELQLDDDSLQMSEESETFDDDEELEMDIEEPELDFDSDEEDDFSSLGRTMVIEPMEDEEEEEEVLTLDGFQQDDEDLLTLDALEDISEEEGDLEDVQELDLENLVLDDDGEEQGLALEDDYGDIELEEEPAEPPRLDPNSTMVLENPDFSKYALVDDKELFSNGPPSIRDDDEVEIEEDDELELDADEIELEDEAAPEQAAPEQDEPEQPTLEMESAPEEDGLDLGDFELGLDDVELDSGALKLESDLGETPSETETSSSDEFDLDALELEELTLGDDDSQTGA